MGCTVAFCLGVAALLQKSAHLAMMGPSENIEQKFRSDSLCDCSWIQGPGCCPGVPHCPPEEHDTNCWCRCWNMNPFDFCPGEFRYCRRGRGIDGTLKIDE